MQELSYDNQILLARQVVSGTLYNTAGLVQFKNKYRELISRGLVTYNYVPQNGSNLFTVHVTSLGKELLAGRPAIEWYRELVSCGHSLVATHYIWQFSLEELPEFLTSRDYRVRRRARDRLEELIGKS